MDSVGGLDCTEPWWVKRRVSSLDKVSYFCGIQPIILNKMSMEILFNHQLLEACMSAPISNRVWRR